MTNSGRAWLSLCCLVSISLAGCGEARNEKQVYKVTGRVLVDGKPAEGVLLGIHDSAPMDKKFPTAPQGQTIADGKLIISTYAEGDGLPEGDYTITFTWQEFNPVSRSYTGPDKLNKRYADPKSSKVTAKVKGPVDLGEIQLTTK